MRTRDNVYRPELAMAKDTSIYKRISILSMTVVAGLAAGNTWAQDQAAGAPAPVVAPSQPVIAPVDAQTAPVAPADQTASPATPAATPPVTLAAAPQTISCLMPPAKLSDEKISEFTNDPQALLSGTESGGMILSTRVNGLAGSSSATLDQIVTLTVGANKAQVQAIGQGLARAATICAKENPPYAALIQSKVAEMNDVTLSSAFVAGLSEVQTASVSSGAGASTGASGIGGNGAAGGGSAGLMGDDSIPTTSGTFNGMGQGSAFSVDANQSTRRLASPN